MVIDIKKEINKINDNLEQVKAKITEILSQTSFKTVSTAEDPYIISLKMADEI